MLSLLFAASLAGSAAAHGAVLSYVIGGTTYAGMDGYDSLTGQASIERPWPNYNPITDATDPTIACNNNGETLTAAGGTQLSATIAAGSKITANWNVPWPHSLGPFSTWMASCEGPCNSANAASLNWFKIDQLGLISGTVGNGVWGLGIIANTSTWTSTIPASLASGEYLFRNELLAIHTSNQPQFYPECAQLIVTGSGTSVPTSAYTCKLPGCYSASDPNIDINVYSPAEQTNTVYTIPGPPVWPAGSGSSTPPPSTTPVKSSSTTITTTTTTKPVTTTTTTASGATQTKYGQCGGTGWTGATVCASGSTCKAVSPPYYSQCQ